MNCKLADGTTSEVTWKMLYPRCHKFDTNCSKLNGAYVAAAVVCRQRL